MRLRRRTDVIVISRASRWQKVFSSLSQPTPVHQMLVVVPVLVSVNVKRIRASGAWRMPIDRVRARVQLWRFDKTLMRDKTFAQVGQSAACPTDRGNRWAWPVGLCPNHDFRARGNRNQKYNPIRSDPCSLKAEPLRVPPYVLAPASASKVQPFQKAESSRFPAMNTGNT